ncbi:MULTISPECIES: hypothetical protein [Paenarthrobacter]|uniref:Uncharacterized protein n=1 Tax=Paenarthrobacter ureafaciens TaxID=37931 RepID=A0AAX3EJ01_PAEUR|nr:MULTISPECIES: hypothetical protein [Paenarthrobacter]MDO5873986.1 hypothetical protein [Paenarthrobacter sp. SD-1]UYV93424.1 hypothetical protein NL395_01540 [Paenarthrobacter ureafaciens]UYV97953.1 hypothetical protein NL394_01500 [Paenarthrobacter ureafaciens]WIV33462.1 hypothetical protein QN084_23250 [Paenarthrobacter sp. R1]
MQVPKATLGFTARPVHGSVAAGSRQLISELPEASGLVVLAPINIA